MHKRPLSPHIQIYNLFKITSLTSILHRLTGIALVGGSLVVVWWLMAVAHGTNSYDCFMSAVRHPLGQLVLFGFTWALWYHLVNGIRHLFWDAGFGFKITVARKTGVAVLVSSIVAALATWLYILSI